MVCLDPASPPPLRNPKCFLSLSLSLDFLCPGGHSLRPVSLKSLTLSTRLGPSHPSRESTPMMTPRIFDLRGVLALSCIIFHGSLGYGSFVLTSSGTSTSTSLVGMTFTWTPGNCGWSHHSLVSPFSGQPAPHPNPPPSNVITDAVHIRTLLIKPANTFDEPLPRRRGYSNESRRVHLVARHGEPMFRRAGTGRCGAADSRPRGRDATNTDRTGSRVTHDRLSDRLSTHPTKAPG